MYLSRSHAFINRAATAQVPLFTPTNTGEICLYNNSTGPHVLVVWDIVENAGVSGIASGYLVAQSQLTTPVGTGVSIITGEPTPVGITSSGDLATPDVVTVDYPAAPSVPACTLPMPLAVLRPGWSIIVVFSTAASAFGGTFFYQWLWAEEFSWNARDRWYETQ